MKKADLIIHPVRLRIMQALTEQVLTTHEISQQLPDVPKSSIYRHLKLLLESGLIAVAETNLVSGIEEKRYQLVASPRLGAEDMADLSASEHLNYFNAYLMTLLRGYADYLSTAEEKGGSVDLLADRVGYTELLFYASAEEMNALQAEVNAALLKLARNQAGESRRRQKLSIITFPTDREGNES